MVVALYSVITAGPRYSLPVLSDSRWQIAVSIGFPSKKTEALSGRS